MYIQKIPTSNNNYNNNPFLERIGKDLLIAKNMQNVVWINWTMVPKLEYLGHLTEDDSKIQIRTNSDIACRRAGQFPIKLVEYFNLNY